jgi:L-fuconate dehydratase
VVKDMADIDEVMVSDVRFPTSLTGDGSDAVNVDTDYSAAYVTLRSRGDDVGFGLTFTQGRGTGLCVDAARMLAAPLVGMSVDEIVSDLGRVYREVLYDTQLRWLGPEKGVIHLAKAAVMNAVWDLAARTAGKPLWQLVADAAPAEIVGWCDFRYLTDAITPAEAEQMLTAGQDGRAERMAVLEAGGFPAYTTAPGWLDYDDDKLRRLCREAVAEGFGHVKLKVGLSLADDLRRCGIAREEIGAERVLMIDANQVWDVEEAIDWVRQLAPFRPLWIEEPTSPDDILGHGRIRRAVAPVGVATGEHAENSVVFKQLLQAEAIDFCQVDSCRLASVNEIVPVLLMAAKFGVPVCPHAGGVGLCEYVQHLAIVDYLCISGSLDDRMLEYVSHLHEHFVYPVEVTNGAYRIPHAPGYSIEMHQESLDTYRFPDGSYWRRS